MANANILIQRARQISDSLATDVAKAYARRPAGARGPITIRDIPEDVSARMVETVREAAPAATRKRLAPKFSAKNYALLGGGTVAGATLFNLDDLGFIDMLLSLTPDAMREVVEDASEADASGDSDVAGAVQRTGDLIYLHDLHNVDFNQHQNMMPLDRTVTSTLSLNLTDVNVLQAWTDLYGLAVEAAGNEDTLEALILISNNTTPEDRAALLDNLKYKRGY